MDPTFIFLGVAVLMGIAVAIAVAVLMKGSKGAPGAERPDNHDRG